MAAEESLKHDWIKVFEKNNPQVQDTEIQSVKQSVPKLFQRNDKKRVGPFAVRKLHVITDVLDILALA